MNQTDRSNQAKVIMASPLWDKMKEDLPRFYYNHFRDSIDPETRERVAMAHDIFDDIVKYVEAQMAMGEILEFPEPSETMNESPAAQH